jgi:Ala-tRNA(Pro) deacylase
MSIPRSISTFLDRHHTQYAVVPHAPAYTAQETAAVAHVPGRAWAKVVVCMADQLPILAVLPAPLRIDFDRLQDASHAATLRLAREGEFARLFPDCEIGAMPPLGPLYRQQVFVDQSLTTDREITFNAGSHRDAIRMEYGEFQRLIKPTVARFRTQPRHREADRTGVRVTDFVCGGLVDETRAWGISEYQRQTYYFCSPICKMEFDDNPAAYAPEPAQPRERRKG